MVGDVSDGLIVSLNQNNACKCACASAQLPIAKQLYVLLYRRLSVGFFASKYML